MQGRGRPQKFDRAEVLSRAMTVFWAKGYQGTAMSDLVETMGLRSASIYGAFGSKEKLFDEVLALYTEQVGSQIWDPLIREPQIRDAIAAMLRASARNMATDTGPGGCLVTLGAIEGGADAGVSDKLRARRQETVQRITARLERAKADNQLPGTTDVERIAVFYSAIQQSIALRARDGASAQELADLIDTAMAAWPAVTATQEAAQLFVDRQIID